MTIVQPTAVTSTALTPFGQMAVCGVVALAPVAAHPLYVAAFRAAERAVRLAEFRRQTVFSMN